MAPHRRETDNCIAKRIYEAATPYVQIIGWVAVVLPILFVAFTYVRDVQAYNQRIESLEEFKAESTQKIAGVDEKVNGIDKKIDLMMDFWRISGRKKRSD